MAAAASLVERLRAKAREAGAPGPVGLDAVRAAERELGFALPPLLRTVYSEISDGGFGPGQEVRLPGYTAAVLYRLDRAVAVYREERAPADPQDDPYGMLWPEGVLPLLYWGCSGYAAVDCRDPDGPVLMFEEDGAAGHAWTIDAVDLTAWWRRWLDGETADTRGPVWTGWRGRL